MKEKVIEIAGKTWRYLGQNGETNVGQLPKALKEKGELVLQAVGWLAREDKINYSIKNRRTFISLVQNELIAFNSLVYNMDQQVQAPAASNSNGNGKVKTKKVQS